MTAADLAKTRLYLAHARFRGQRSLANDNEVIARKLLHELGRDPVVTSAEQLDALHVGAVVRDAEGWVCERFPAGWYAVSSTRLREVHLPAEVYFAGEEES